MTLVSFNYLASRPFATYTQLASFANKMPHALLRESLL